MTEPKQNRLTRDEVLALRGLRLPQVALKGLQRAGICCQPGISLERQQGSRGYVIRGVESGGAVAHIGAYCGFVDDAGAPLPVLQPVTSVGVNGLHAGVLSSGLVRVQMFRTGITYELLLTHHFLVPVEGKARPRLQSSVVFHGRHGTLEMELWGKDLQLRGMVAPVFYTKSGEQTRFPDRFHDAVLRVTAGASCVGCRHRHLPNFGTRPGNWRVQDAG